MTAYLISFGYETPTQRSLNDSQGWGDEDSASLWVASESPEAALAWGESVALEFVRRLYRQVGQEVPESLAGQSFPYATWIETGHDELAQAEARVDLPTIEVGELPDFEPWVRATST